MKTTTKQTLRKIMLLAHKLFTAQKLTSFGHALKRAWCLVKLCNVNIINNIIEFTHKSFKKLEIIGIDKQKSTFTTHNNYELNLFQYQMVDV